MLNHFERDDNIHSEEDFYETVNLILLWIKYSGQSNLFIIKRIKKKKHL